MAKSTHSDRNTFTRQVFAYEGLCAQIEATSSDDEDTIDRLVDDSQQALVALIDIPVVGASDLAEKLRVIQQRHGSRNFGKEADGDFCVTFNESFLVQMIKDADAMSDNIEKHLANALVILEAAKNALGEQELKFAKAREMNTQDCESHRLLLSNAGCMIAVAREFLNQVEA